MQDHGILKATEQNLVGLSVIDHFGRLLFCSGKHNSHCFRQQTCWLFKYLGILYEALFDFSTWSNVGVQWKFCTCNFLKAALQLVVEVSVRFFTFYLIHRFSVVLSSPAFQYFWERLKIQLLTLEKITCTTLFSKE